MLERLQVLLCTLEVVKSNVKGRHWTLTGHKFRSWHNQFDDIYKSLEEAVDNIGELIIQAGDIPYHALSQFLDNSLCDDQLSVVDWENMVRDTDRELGIIIAYINDSVKMGLFDPATENDLTAIASSLKHERMFCSQTLDKIEP